jgi:two-component system sensor kinase FixL
MNGSGLQRRSIAMAFPRIFSLPHSVIGLTYVVGYVLLDWVSFIHPFAPFGITPWNPPTGLSFILVLLFGQRFIPLLFVAPLLADLLVRQLPLPWSVEIVTTVIVGGGYSAGLMFLLRPITRFNPALTSMRDLIILIAVAAISGAFVSTSYVGVLIGANLVSTSDFTRAALQYWIGDIIGVAIISPVALIFLTRGRALEVSGENALQIVAILAALAFVFAYPDQHHFQFFYILFLPVIWMAVRGGLEFVTIGILVTQIGLIVGAQFLPKEDIDVTAFQALMLVLTMTGLAAGAVVTENRRTQFQLRLHQDSLSRLARLGSMGELAAMIAHEINQPLMAASTYTLLVADALRSPDATDADVLETAENAALQVQRAAEVVRQLRALIRLDRTGRAPVSVERIVRETLDLCRPELDRHGAVIRLMLDANLPPVMVDLLQVEQVLLYLFRNAAEAINQADHAGGVITIKASAVAPDHVAINVSDSGPGFPPEFGSGELPLLTSSKSEGLGIGLALCRSIIESHGGHLSISGGAGGAVVCFTLPVAKGG